jgi:hypothetical protein
VDPLPGRKWRKSVWRRGGDIFHKWIHLEKLKRNVADGHKKGGAQVYEERGEEFQNYQKRKFTIFKTRKRTNFPIGE